jgi:hypothetical protein
MRILLASILNFVLFHWAIMGSGRINLRSLKTTGNKKKFQPRQKKTFLFKSYMTPLYLLKIVFLKFDFAQPQ